jgi:hypothetical protein
MKKWRVYPQAVVVEAERLWAGPEGGLRFYNVSTRADVAGFAPGEWGYYVEIKAA